MGSYLSNGFDHGFLLDGQSFTTIDFPGALSTDALDINNGGQIVGVYLDQGGREHGFELSAGTFTTIEPPGAHAAASGINNLGDIVGSISPEGDAQGFAYSGGIFTTRIAFPGASATYAHGVNDRRQVVGYTHTLPGRSQGFAFFQGSFVPLNFRGARSTIPWGINNSGDIVGYYFAGDAYHGFLRTRGAD